MGKTYIAKGVLKFLVLFMSLLIICTLCGGLFGISAGGTFTQSFSKFGGFMSGLRIGIIDPLNDFLRFFGLNSSYGGTAIVYKLSPDDVIQSNLIPRDAYYAAFSFMYKTSEKSMLQKPIIVVFFNENGEPISALAFSADGKQSLLTSGKKFSYSYYFTSVDCSKSYFNPMSKYLYFDVELNCKFFNVEPMVIECYFDSSLVDYEYAGTFSDLQKGLT